MSDKKKKKKKLSPVFIIVLLACIGVIAFAGYKLISIGLTYKEAQDEYDRLREYTVEVKPTEAKADSSESSAEPTDPEDPESTGTAAGVSADGIPLLKEMPPLEVDCAALKQINPDFAAWLYLGAENISYPVVHGKDNDYYLHRTFEGTYNFAGTLFIECENNPDFKDPHTLIYGHNMKDRSMFGNLKFLYETEDYKEDDSFWIITAEHAYKYQIFSIQSTRMDSDVYTLFFGPSPEVTDYIVRRASESLITFPLGVYDENSRVVTLSTCQTADSPERFVVQGILIGESEPYAKSKN